MNGINLMTLVGTVARDIELRHAASGTAIANISIATNYTPKNGEEQSEFHRVVCFNRTAEIANEYLRKGSKCGVIGRLQTREWEKDGVKRYSTEIICDSLQLIDSKRDNPAQSHTGADRQPSNPQGGTATQNMSGGGESDFDSIPFAKVDGRYV